MKKRISAEYPESRYAQIMNNTNANAASLTETPESTHTKWYKLYEQEQFVTVLENSDALISQFSGDEIVSKLNCLKQTLWKIERIIRL
jgi:thiaminase